MKKSSQYRDSMKFTFWGMIGVGIVMVITMVIQTIYG